MAIEPDARKLEADAVRHASGQSRTLAASLPRLMLESRRIAATVIHGLHGRRRSGSGENFWQYRRFLSGEPARHVDWRRSARDDHLYVREREWEAAHTVWIWPDRSPSMAFASPVVWETKLERTLVIAFALAEILVEGGERVGVPGLMRPTASRNVIDKMAQVIVHDTAERTSLPPGFAPASLSEVVLLSDFWSPIPDFRRALAQLSGAHARIHVVQIVDPAEETFPYSGRVEFLEPEGLGSITAGRAETWRSEYFDKLAAHRSAMREESDRVHASFIIHRTDRPASELVLALHARMGESAEAPPVITAPVQRTGAGMIGGLPLGFAQPLALLGLLSLPVLWWLLRMISPRPRRIEFPPARLLFDIAPKEETPARTPWWLTLLRLTLAALLIIAAAGPMWNPPIATSGEAGPLAIMIDDGWAAASTWDTRIRTGDDMLARAEADGRAAALIPMSEAGRSVVLQTAAATRVQLRQMTPKPHAVERTDALPALTRFLSATPNAELVWLSDGVHLGRAGEFVTGLAGILGERSMTVIDGGVTPALALSTADNNAGSLTVKALRAAEGGGQAGIVRAYDIKGLLLGEAPFTLKAGEREAEASINLPVELRNDIARLDIAGERSAGAVQLLDKRWRRRSVGVITGATADTAQPLLASTFYLQRALGPFADVRMGERVSPSDMVVRFLDQNVPMLILADVGNVVGRARERLARWVEDGGVLVRFAGPRLAASDDELVPVRLRRGGRTLGGSLSWEKPQPLASFSRESPFGGMTVPGDVTVNRQVLAEPDSGLAERSWAMLADGTPLVTGARRGKGMIVLFHVTADTRWSDLPLSGAFVEMLKRLVSLAGSTATAEQASAERDRETLSPARTLDGFGALSAPPGNAKPVAANYAGRATTDHPPGFYGPPEGLLAVNTLTASDKPEPVDVTPLNARRDVYRLSEPLDLRGPVFLAGFGLLLIDALVVFWLGGGLSRLSGQRRRAIATAVAVAIACSGFAHIGPAEAQTVPPPRPAAAAPSATAENFAMKSANETKLAYVITGDAETDAVSRAGLSGLTLFLAQRTALEAGEPVGLDIARDELNFFPLIYWPIVPGAAKPSPEALARIDTYMKQGGTVLFDTRDAIMAPPGPGGEARSPGMLALREILSSLDIPELEPVSKDHVLTKTFFLLRDFPGRFNTGQLWVEALPAQDELDGETENRRPARAGDGVSSLLITSNDFAGAWAMRPDGQQMLPMVSTEPRQREMAYRAGVNIVMYTLTGNYKADQVHVPALLERLGQ